MPETQRNLSSSPYGPCMCNGNSPRRAAVLLLTLVDIEMYPLEADTVRLSAVVCLLVCSVLLCVPCVCVCAWVCARKGEQTLKQPTPCAMLTRLQLCLTPEKRTCHRSGSDKCKCKSRSRYWPKQQSSSGGKVGKQIHHDGDRDVDCDCGSLSKFGFSFGECFMLYASKVHSRQIKTNSRKSMRERLTARERQRKKERKRERVSSWVSECAGAASVITSVIKLERICRHLLGHTLCNHS